MRLKSFPEIGSTRKIVCFAFLPTVMSNFERVWLERYEVTQLRKTLNAYLSDDPSFGYWFVQSRRRLKG